MRATSVPAGAVDPPATLRAVVLFAVVILIVLLGRNTPLTIHSVVALGPVRVALVAHLSLTLDAGHLTVILVVLGAKASRALISLDFTVQPGHIVAVSALLTVITAEGLVAVITVELRAVIREEALDDGLISPKRKLLAALKLNKALEQVRTISLKPKLLIFVTMDIGEDHIEPVVVTLELVVL